MKLEIDTQRDSDKDIRAAIVMLQNLVGDTQSSYSAPKEEEVPDIAPAAFDMFGGSLAPTPEQEKEEEKEEVVEKVTFMEY
jgi:hypothetical protein